MELFISINTARPTFIGDYPTKIGDCLKRCKLMTGASMENFAKIRTGSAAHQRGKVKRSKNGPRNWLAKSPISEIFRERYLGNGSVTWTLPNINALLNQPNLPPYLHSLREQRNKSQPLNMPQVLTLLKYAVQSEGRGLLYDYFSMSFRYLDLLRALQVALDEGLKEYFRAEFPKRESQLPSISRYIIDSRLGTEFQGSFRKTPVTSGVFNRLLCEGS
jgi:hypothetical protein